LITEQDPDYQTQLDAWDQQMANISSFQERSDEYIIPIVVHVMHNNGEENISDAQIYQAIREANEQLRGEEGGFDTNIELRLARVDPNGACTGGITRNQITTPDVTPSNNGEDAAFKDQIRWPVDRYLNIWVVRCILPDSDCNDQFGTGGYSYLPPVSDALDGIVIAHRFMGTTGTASDNTLKTLSHEAGHYLALYHVWGQDWFGPTQDPCQINCHNENDCLTLGDRVCDTSPCRSALLTASCSQVATNCENCPSFPVDQYFYPKENYMSYTHPCQDRFTEGQAMRMQMALDNFRGTLWSEENLICTGAYLFGDGGGVYVQSDETWTVNSLLLSNDGEYITRLSRYRIRSNIDSGIRCCITFLRDGQNYY